MYRIYNKPLRILPVESVTKKRRKWWRRLYYVFVVAVFVYSSVYEGVCKKKVGKKMLIHFTFLMIIKLAKIMLKNNWRTSASWSGATSMMWRWGGGSGGGESTTLVRFLRDCRWCAPVPTHINASQNFHLLSWQLFIEERTHSPSARVYHTRERIYRKKARKKGKKRINMWNAF
jgi:hypothetical protein